MPHSISPWLLYRHMQSTLVIALFIRRRYPRSCRIKSRGSARDYFPQQTHHRENSLLTVHSTRLGQHRRRILYLPGYFGPCRWSLSSTDVSVRIGRVICLNISTACQLSARYRTISLSYIIFWHWCRSNVCYRQSVLTEEFIVYSAKKVRQRQLTLKF